MNALENMVMPTHGNSVLKFSIFFAQELSSRERFSAYMVGFLLISRHLTKCASSTDVTKFLMKVLTAI